MTDTSAAGLAEAIEAIRGELRQAQEAGRGQDVRFSVGSVEIELAVEVVKSGGGEASVKVLNLLSIGGKGGVSRSAVNRVTVVLDPVTAGGAPFEVASARARRPDGTAASPGQRPGG